LGNQGEQTVINTPECKQNTIVGKEGCRCGYYKQCMTGQYCSNNICKTSAPTKNYNYKDTECGKKIQILNQGNCGSCFIQSSTQALAHRYCMAHGVNSIKGTFAPQ